jgi:fumarate hydratase subunit beta
MSSPRTIEWQSGFPAAEFAALRAGDAVELTGSVLTLRDASAARIADALGKGEALATPLENRVMYAVGPSPAKPGRVIGSAGPTTTARMGRYFPALFAAGVRAIVGKGELHGTDMEACTAHGVVYLAAIGGLGALLAERISAARVVAYPELGPEALYELELNAFPAVVIIDRFGRNLHDTARGQWRTEPGPRIS